MCCGVMLLLLLIYVYIYIYIYTCMHAYIHMISFVLTFDYENCVIRTIFYA